MATLIIEEGGEVRRVPLTGAVVLGRSSECDHVLADPRLSRRHCAIRPAADGGFLVEDLDSRSGTHLAGTLLAGPTPLLPGDWLELGAVRVGLELQSSPILSGQAARDSRNLELLLEILDEALLAEGVDELLRCLLDRALVLAGGDRGAILLRAPDGSLEKGLGRDADGADLVPDDVVSRRIPERVLEAGRAVVLTDTTAPEQRSQATPSIRGAGVRSVICAPLPGTDAPLGVLYVDGFRPASAFGPADLSVFEALATHGAVALERVRLLEEARQRERQTRSRLEAENDRLRSQLSHEGPLGESPAMRDALQMLERVASSDATVCLSGQTGCGKEVLARHLHRLSSRARKAFVVVDCGALPESLIESELFGHEKGAFTGAAQKRAGRFREADGGTLFLDEIGELPKSLQPRLLRVLQERTVQPVGGSGRVTVDVRVVAATHRDLQKMVAEGSFRQDLFYRLGIISVPIPPLRARGDDVLLLARKFLLRFSAERGAEPCELSLEASEALRTHDWPGNVRELEQRIQRAVLLARPPFITCADLGLGREQPGRSEASFELPPLQEARASANRRFERDYVEQALTRSAGNVAEAAALAQVSPQLLRRLIRLHDIDKTRFAGS